MSRGESQQMTLKPVPTFGRFMVTSSVVITMNMGCQLYVLKEETFLIPLKYSDVTRSTHADLDVLQEKRIDEEWSVVSNGNLSNSWKGFTRFAQLKEKPSKGFFVVGEETDKNSNDYPTRSCMARSLDEDR